MNLLEKLMSQNHGIQFLWTGNDGWLIWDGLHLIATDLDLFNPERLHPPMINPEELARHLDAIFVTHEHEDHFNRATCQLLAEHGSCYFVIPRSCQEKAEFLPSERTILVQPGKKLDQFGMQIECVRAIHGHLNGSVYSGASTLDCGYRFQTKGYTIYQPGDTLLLEEHQTMPATDVLMISPTEHNTWIANSRLLISALSPRLILPQHFGTYGEAEDNRFWTHGYVDELYAALDSMQQSRYHIPCPEEPISFV